MKGRKLERGVKEKRERETEREITYGAEEKDLPTLSAEDAIGNPRIDQGRDHLDGVHPGRIQVDLGRGVLGIHVVLEILREDRGTACSAHEAAAVLAFSFPSSRGRGARGSFTYT